jgi:hypothetical protein
MVPSVVVRNLQPRAPRKTIATVTGPATAYPPVSLAGKPAR